MHVIVCVFAIQPIQHTHQGEDKNQVQLELNMYFGKLIRMTTSTHLKINMETMHQCVSDSVAPKKTTHMLANELDERGETDALFKTEARVFFSKMSPRGAYTPSHTTKLGISSPPSPSRACQRVCLIIENRVSVMSCKACSSHVV